MPIRPSSSSRRIVRSARTTSRSYGAHGQPLRREPLAHPRLAVAAVAQTVVQAVVAVLPELEDLRPDPPPAPGGRPLGLRAQGLAHRLDPRLELVARADHLALRRHPRAD